MTIAMMERHPLGSQAFITVQNRPYLVVVAESVVNSKEPGRGHAFIARGDQGVNYATDLWHHPSIAVDEVSDFFLVDRQGDGHNCDEFTLAQALSLEYSA